MVWPAPLPPSTSKSARTLRTQRITGQIHPLLPSKIYRPDAHVTDDFLSTKRDKRLIKHSSFLSRIATTAPTSSTGSRSKITKSSSRRPKNKLKTSLQGLADALPEIQDGEGARPGLEGKVRHRSLSSKKGALRRKEKLVRGEMKRFGASMAVLAAGAKDENGRADGEDDANMQGVQEQVSGGAQAASAAQGPTSNRWAALRGYISSTMEQSPAFLDK
ncbi:hypothetical protein E4U56_002450 [Claviceps arundinis]|uniref:Ribosome biogenesis protein SLX9 n=1 Tax=Claviceps arundinis TaxID=1623583 RepID=A0A9P7MYU7_9HYPO|nr:hypothetical protein E4U56_002450 [Claviceps arundinis]